MPGWIVFALMTVVCWGLYGVLLHTGETAMSDPADGRYKAFLWVGIAYMFIAVLAPLVMLILHKASWTMPARGIMWSTIAGVAGAVGAFCVLLAFAAKGHPSVVMSIVFAGAPIVNALVALSIHPPAGGLSSIRWPFLVGIVMAAAGALLVTLYRPAAAPAASKAAGPSARMGTPAPQVVDRAPP